VGDPIELDIEADDMPPGFATGDLTPDPMTATEDSTDPADMSNVELVEDPMTLVTHNNAYGTNSSNSSNGTNDSSCSVDVDTVISYYETDSDTSDNEDFDSDIESNTSDSEDSDSDTSDNAIDNNSVGSIADLVDRVEDQNMDLLIKTSAEPVEVAQDQHTEHVEAAHVEAAHVEAAHVEAAQVEAAHVEAAKDDSDSNSDSESSMATLDDPVLMATVGKYPVLMICMEQCENTLDHLLHTDVPEVEIISALMQVIMQLLHYQRLYQFTHNDLHTGNIMYVSTDLAYLHYSVDGHLYRVPTFGRIFKIIDFGRAIYTVNGKRYCSNNYAPNNEAAGMFNVDPYRDPNKPELVPSYSVDLCRLGLSMYDFFDYRPNEDGETYLSPLETIIQDWCTDDLGQNLLYKRDGSERYPDFKLYKMMVRTAHTHTPMHQLQNPHFKRFRVLAFPPSSSSSSSSAAANTAVVNANTSVMIIGHP
jgi:hypothetical protein